MSTLSTHFKMHELKVTRLDTHTTYVEMGGAIFVVVMREEDDNDKASVLSIRLRILVLIE
jgi:hypothetical protein